MILYTIGTYAMSFSLKIKLFYTISILLSFSIVMLINNFEIISFKVFQYPKLLNVAPNIYTSWLLGLCVFLFFTFLVSLFNNKDYLKLWLIKSFVTLIFMLLYEYVYNLDAYMYYARALYIEEVSFFNNATDNVIMLTKILSHFVGESFYSLKITYSLMGFIGLIFFYKCYLYILKKNNIESFVQKEFMYVLFLFPTIIFWSSTLGKEPLTLFFVGMFTYNFIKSVDSYNLENIFFVVLSIIGVTFIRPWWGVIFTIVIILSMINFKSKVQMIIVSLLLPFSFYIIWIILSARGMTSIDQLFHHMYLTSTQMANGNSAIAVNDISTLWGYLYYYIPNLFTTLFRPMFYEVTNMFTLLSAIENIILLYLFLRYILFKPIEILNNKHLRILAIFIFVWSLIYVIISPTNLGTAVRFKLQILPIILILVYTTRSIVLMRRSS